LYFFTPDIADTPAVVPEYCVPSLSWMYLADSVLLIVLGLRMYWEEVITCPDR
jgi:hypothetical protein